MSFSDFKENLIASLADQAKTSPIKLTLEVMSLTWAVSVFVWILTQINALPYSALSFFSFTQAVNDGITVFPLLLMVFVGWCAGYYAARYLWILLSFVKNDGPYVFAAVLSVLVLLRALIIGLDFSKNVTGNLEGYACIAGLYSMSALLLILSLYVLFACGIANYKTGKIERMEHWLTKADGYLPFFFLSLFFTFSYFAINDTPKSINWHNCVEFEQRYVGISYLNDKYVFTNDGRVLENKGRTFYRNTNCDKSNTDFYIRKDSECMKVDNFDKDFISVSKIWLVSNKGYDFYTNRECKPAP